MKNSHKKYLFGLLLGVITLLLMEGMLNVLTVVSPSLRAIFFPNESSMIDDPILGHRPSPRFSDHDERGFRNATAPESAQVVALGDSFTYGAMGTRENAWPQQLEAISGVTTYNMGFGGYGPAHAYILLKEALELRPELVVLGMYSGNDLFDCFSIVYHGNTLAEFRSTDNDVLLSIAESDAAGLLASPEKPSIFSRAALLQALKKHSRLYGLLRAVRNLARGSIWNMEEPTWEEVKAVGLKPGERFFETPTVKTVFTIEKRIIALNLDDPRIREGHRISLDVIQRINEIAKEKNFRFVVALFPTKEFAFAELAIESGMDEEVEAFRKLTAYEQKMWGHRNSFSKRTTFFSLTCCRIFEKCFGKAYFPTAWMPMPISVLSEIRRLPNYCTILLSKRDCFRMRNSS